MMGLVSQIVDFFSVKQMPFLEKQRQQQQRKKNMSSGDVSIFNKRFGAKLIYRASWKTSCDVNFHQLETSHFRCVKKWHTMFSRLVYISGQTRWGPLITISGFIRSQTHLQPWLNRVCLGYNYLITGRGAPS